MHCLTHDIDPDVEFRRHVPFRSLIYKVCTIILARCEMGLGSRKQIAITYVCTKTSAITTVHRV